MNPEDTISFDEMERQDRERRARENPWTAADEARFEAKRKAEQAARAKWLAENPEAGEEDEDEGEDEET